MEVSDKESSQGEEEIEEEERGDGVRKGKGVFLSVQYIFSFLTDPFSSNQKKDR